MKRITLLMTALLFMFSYAGLAQVESGTMYSTPNVEGLPEGWSGEDGGGTSYIKLIAAEHYIQTANFEQNGFTSVVVKARKFGGPSVAQAQITVSWYDSDNVETVLGTLDPTTTTLTNYSIDAPATVENGTGYIKIQCKGASASKGAGVSEVTINYVVPGGVPTYTVTYDCNGGTEGCPENVTGVESGSTIYLANGPTLEDYDFAGWSDGENTYDEGDEYTVTGNVTFTAQWTPQSGNEVQWVLTNLADLTSTDIFVIVGNNGNNFAMANNGGSSNAPSAIAVTVANNELTSVVTADIQWNISGNADDGYTFYPNGTTETWLYCFNNNNGLRVGTGEDNLFVINNDYLYNSGQGRYIGIYSSQNWRSYTSINSNITGQTFAFYKKVTDGVIPPSISADNVEIAYNATSGSFDFTVNHPVEGGTTTVAEEVDWISNAAISGNSITFTTTVNEAGTARHGVITLTYTYNRATVTKDVTVTQLGNPNTTMTIAEVREQGTGNVVTTGTVTSCVGTTGYIQDATAAICVYGAELTVGDQIRVEGTLSTYHGLLEITSPVVTVLSSGNTVEPELMTIAEINESTNQGWYVRIEEATVTAISGQNTTIAQGDNTIVVRGISGVEYAVNDLLTLNGNIGCYDAAQIANPQNVEVQQSTEPAITVTPATVNAAAEETTGTLTVTYVEVNEAEAEVYFCGADGMPVSYDWIIADLDTDNNVEYVIEANEGEARTAYLMVVVGEIASNLVTINQAEYVTPALGYAELPFAFDGGKADIETTDGLTQNGLGSDYGSSPKLKFDGTGDWMILHFNEEPGQFSFVIKGTGSPFLGTFIVETSVDGVEYETLATYTELGDAETMTFTTLDADVRYIRWYFTEKVSGCNVGIGDIHLYKVGGAPASITVDPATVNATAAETEGTLTVTYTNITNIVAEVFFCNAEGEAEEYDWIFADIDNDNNIEYLIDANPANARTAYLKVYALDDDAHEVYSNLVTINQDAYVAPFTGTRYNMITTTANIESGRHYIIAGWKDNQAYAMGLQNGNNRAAVAINIDNDGWAYVDSSDVYEFVINGPDADGNYFFYDTNEASTGYLYAASSSSNYLRTEEFLDALGNGLWSIEIAEIGNAATVIAQGDHERNWMRFNSNNNNPPIFSCYGSTSNQKDIYLFVKEEDETFEFFKDIVGFGEGNGDWHLVSTPFDDVEPEDANMPAEEAEEYDLYWFNPTATGEEWRNYKTAPFNLYMGKGYLYASKSPVTLHFEGDEILGEGNEEVTLEYEGFNLVGNPFARLATVDADFYVMSDGYEIAIADRDYVKPMEGIFVEAATQGQSVTFSSLEVGVGGNEPDQQNKLNIRVTDNNGNSDIARIRFGEGRGLEKLMLNENHNKLYFVVDGNEYAVTYAANKGEMPVYFKAAEDGTYTLTVSATLNSQLSTLNFNYLHLIDNLSGAEVDLLVNPSYSFEARTTDNAARFRLVFSK